MSRTLRRTAFIAGCCLVGHAALADDAPSAAPATTEQSQALKDVQAEAALAKAKLELATSEIDLLKLKLGTIDTTNLPKGNATVTDMDVEGQLRAYAAAAKAIEAIATAVAANKAVASATTVVLATEAQLQAINQHRAFLTQMDMLETGTKAILAEPLKVVDPPACKNGVLGPKLAGGAAMGGAVVAINSLLGVAALFKTDVDLKGKAVTLNDFGFTSMLLEALQAKVKVIYPATFYILPPPDPKGATVAAYKKVTDLKKPLKEAAEKATGDFVLIPVPAKPTEGCKAALAQLKQAVDQYVAGLVAIVKSIDDVGTTLTRQDAQSGLTLLSSYLVSERIENAIGATTPVLLVKPIAAGGSTQTRKNLFTTSISYGGGTIVSYQLFSQDGTVLAADTIAWYAGFKNAKDFAAGKVSLD